MINSQSKRVIYITEGDKSIQYRYRCDNIRKALDGNRKWEMQTILVDEVSRVTQRINEADLVVLERQSAKKGVVLDLIREAKKNNIPVLFDLDDLVFDFRDLFLMMWFTNSKNIFYWGAYFWVIRRVAKRVDGFLCTNDFLAGKLKRSFKKPVRVIRNSLNREQIEVSEKIVKEKVSLKKDKKLIVGYFSGSPTHTKDFRMVEPELVRFLEMYEDAELRVVGDMDYSDEMMKWIRRGRVKTFGKVDYLKLQKLMAEVDVNIAPLVINEFTNCKSELKFFEAAIVDTTTIASPTFTFKKAITDGENGFLAYPGEWYDKLEYLYKHPKENRIIASAAKKYAMKHYYGKEFLKEVEAAYDYFAK